MLKIAIFPNFQKKNAAGCAKAACDILKNKAELYIDVSYQNEFCDKKWVNFGNFTELIGKMDIIMAIGGDGTILRCARYIKSYDAKLLGINTGTLGFMASLEMEQLNDLEKLVTGDYIVRERMMLDVSTVDETGAVRYHSTALNDVIVSKPFSKIFNFDVIADSYRIGSYRADGAVFSTPTGSTAYALSSGGPVIEPDLECIEMNLICPHSLFSRPVIFSKQRTIKLTHKSDISDDVYICVDGNEPVMLKSSETVVIKESACKIKLIDMHDNTFFSALDNKLVKAIKK